MAGLMNMSFALIFLNCLLLTSFVFSAEEKEKLEQGNIRGYINHLRLISNDVGNTAEDGTGTSYSYDTDAYNGPENWGNLNPEWELCGTGKSQSPINILDYNTRVSPLGDLIRKYKPASAVIKREVHEVVVEWEEDAGGIIINDTEYKLLQCHWHTPTEHTFDQQRYDAELHLVHQNVEGDKAVVGILYTLGAPDPFLTWLLPHLIYSQPHLGQVNPLWIGLADREYYRYNGSLTTPPCSENVTWTLFKRVRTVSPYQVAVLRAAIEDGYFGNARPLQALNGRTVYKFQPSSSI